MGNLPSHCRDTDCDTHKATCKQRQPSCSQHTQPPHGPSVPNVCKPTHKQCLRAAIGSYLTSPQWHTFLNSDAPLHTTFISFLEETPEHHALIGDDVKGKKRKQTDDENTPDGKRARTISSDEKIQLTMEIIRELQRDTQHNQDGDITRLFETLSGLITVETFRDLLQRTAEKDLDILNNVIDNKELQISYRVHDRDTTNFIIDEATALEETIGFSLLSHIGTLDIDIKVSSNDIDEIITKTVTLMDNIIDTHVDLSIFPKFKLDFNGAASYADAMNDALQLRFFARLAATESTNIVAHITEIVFELDFVTLQKVDFKPKQRTKNGPQWFAINRFAQFILGDALFARTLRTKSTQPLTNAEIASGQWRANEQIVDALVAAARIHGRTRFPRLIELDTKPLRSVLVENVFINDIDKRLFDALHQSAIVLVDTMDMDSNDEGTIIPETDEDDSDFDDDMDISDMDSLSRFNADETTEDKKARLTERADQMSEDEQRDIDIETYDVENGPFLSHLEEILDTFPFNDTKGTPFTYTVTESTFIAFEDIINDVQIAQDDMREDAKSAKRDKISISKQLIKLKKTKTVLDEQIKTFDGTIDKLADLIKKRNSNDAHIAKAEARSKEFPDVIPFGPVANPFKRLNLIIRINMDRFALHSQVNDLITGISDMLINMINTHKRTAAFELHLLGNDQLHADEVITSVAFKSQAMRELLRRIGQVERLRDDRDLTKKTIHAMSPEERTKFSKLSLGQPATKWMTALSVTSKVQDIRGRFFGGDLSDTTDDDEAVRVFVFGSASGKWSSDEKENKLIVGQRWLKLKDIVLQENLMSENEASILNKLKTMVGSKRKRSPKATPTTRSLRTPTTTTVVTSTTTAQIPSTAIAEIEEKIRKAKDELLILRAVAKANTATSTDAERELKRSVVAFEAAKDGLTLQPPTATSLDVAIAKNNMEVAASASATAKRIADEAKKRVTQAVKVLNALKAKKRRREAAVKNKDKIEKSPQSPTRTSKPLLVPTTPSTTIVVTSPTVMQIPSTATAETEEKIRNAEDDLRVLRAVAKASKTVAMDAEKALERSVVAFEAAKDGLTTQPPTATSLDVAIAKNNMEVAASASATAKRIADEAKKRVTQAVKVLNALKAKKRRREAAAKKKEKAPVKKNTTNKSPTKKEKKKTKKKATTNKRLKELQAELEKEKKKNEEAKNN